MAFKDMRVFENRVLRRIFEPKTKKVREGWRQLRKEELHDGYSTSDIVRMIKSRRKRWNGHAEHIEFGWSLRERLFWKT